MIATALEHNGATVYIVGRRLDVLEQAAKEHSRHAKLLPVQCDISSSESIQTLVDNVKRRHGYLNLLVNNAGVALNQLPKLPTPQTGDIKTLQAALLTGPREDYAKTFDVNVTAAFYCSVQFLELLDAGNKRGNMTGMSSQIITVSSLGGFRRDDKVFTISYTLSKAAAIHLGKLLANFLKDWDIRSNVIAPGVFPSEMSDGLISPDLIKAAVPAGREGSTDDMAGLVLYLASRAGAYINGSVQLIDGGRLSLFSSTY